MVNTEPRSGAAEDQSRGKKGQQFHAVSNISWSVKFQFYLVHFELFFEIFNLVWGLAVWKTVENDQVALIKMFFMCVVFL